MKTKFHYHIHKTLQLDPIMNQINPAHMVSCCVCKIHFNIILLSVNQIECHCSD